MGNKFEFQVVALDRFTATFRNLNNQASRAVRPLTNMGRQVGSLAREMHLDRVASGMGRVAGAAVSMSRAVGMSLGPLEGLLGVGAAGGIVAGVGVVGAALASLAARAGASGYEVSRTARALNLSTGDLQRYRGAANLAGVSTDDMTAALGSLGSTLHEADVGRNNEAVAMLKKLGIEIQHTADGAVYATPTLVAMSRAISRTSDPYTQAVIAGAFGLEQALPLLRQGPEAVEKLAKAAEDLGLVRGQKALDWSNRFGDSLNRLKASANGVSNSIGDDLLPFMVPGMDAASKWLGSKAKATDSHLVRDTLLGGRTMPLVMQTMHWFDRDKGPSASGTVGDYVPGTDTSSRVWVSGGDPMKARPVGGISEDVQNAARYVKGPLSLEQQQQVYNEVQQQLHIKVEIPNAPPGTKVTASTPAGFQPTRVSYSTAGEGSGP